MSHWAYGRVETTDDGDAEPSREYLSGDSPQTVWPPQSTSTLRPLPMPPRPAAADPFPPGRGLSFYRSSSHNPGHSIDFSTTSSIPDTPDTSGAVEHGPSAYGDANSDPEAPLLQSPPPNIEYPTASSRHISQASQMTYVQEEYERPGSSEFDNTKLVDPPPRRAHPIPSRRHERPAYDLLFTHALYCFGGFVVVYLGGANLHGLPIFWARAVVSMLCGGVGYLLSISLLFIIRRSLEAAIWATVVHESMQGNKGVTLRDLSQLTYKLDPRYSWAGWLLLYRRMRKYTGVKRQNRQYDTRYWSIYILGFIMVALMTEILTFTLERIVVINTAEMHQFHKWTQTSVIGDLSPADDSRAAANRVTFQNAALSWTLKSVAASLDLPQAITFPWNNDPIYFSEALASQLLPNGTGFGTFDNSAGLGMGANPENLASDKTTGAVLKWPRWGLRTKCTSLPDPQTNIVMAAPSSFDYAYVPRSVMSSLFGAFSLPVPQELNQPFSPSTLMGNDVPPAAIDTNNIAFAAPFATDGVGFSISSMPLLNTGADGSGWVQVETVMVRLNTSLTPIGVFPAHRNTPQTGNLGYDVAVCIEIVEPYVLSVSNDTSGTPRTMGIMSKMNTVLGNETTGAKGDEKPLAGLTSVLNSMGKADAWIAAHANSRNVMLKDNGRDAKYVPSPTVVSFTSGSGPSGYTQLDPAYVASTLGEADASNLLPYLVGSGLILAHEFPNTSTAWTEVHLEFLVLFTAVVLVAGILAGVFVPTLPLGLPRRDLSPVTLATLRADGLPWRTDPGWEDEELVELDERFGGAKLRLGV
ncbi:hypothetical protein BOTBODRAFT_178430 [Botryobasidium botryosum FD-172 SS1]|uniref:Uncharacterized protein n=1 Tax=Botryobasidium botryosum (strain FD-172 SS1) TaxID=930990 RepID=A0A067MEP1_BOTB1|nr:hypothetical protein BOTBODRAFT_178430 [Botryobasidium botryosum FD-172 SS1]